MTEDEAKTKWCPIMANIGGKQTKTVSDGVTEETVIDLQGFKCIGSACMAWRETIANIDESKPFGEKVTKSGYCGLAGKP